MILTRLHNISQNQIHKRRLRNLKFGAIGQNVIIEKNFTFLNSHNLLLGDHIYIGPEAWMSLFGKVYIKTGTIIGPRVKIYTANHNYETAEAIPYDEKLIIRDVYIGENVWIGGDVIILPGVIIGEGCIIGAGAVVTKNIPDFCIVGGNPAQVIKHRDIERYNLLKNQGKIYLKIKNQNIEKE